MQCGGAERVVYNLYEHFLAEKHDVMLMILGEIDNVQFPGIQSKHVKQYRKSKKNGKLSQNLQKVMFIRKNISMFGADVVVSFIDSTNILACMASIFSNTPLIISERNNPERATMSQPWFFLRKLLYRFASTLVVANKGLKDKCNTLFSVKHIDIIPNIVSPNRATGVSEKRIIAVGSLSKQKRFDVLIDAVDLLHKKNRLSGYTVHIFGKGPLFEKLNDLILRNDLTNVIYLEGQKENILVEYPKSDIFVLSSDYEGQPNVLLEAMNSGLACVSTNCDFGPPEIIEDGVNGLLVEVGNAQCLANAVGELIENPEKRKALGLRAQQSIKENFTHEVVLKKWFDLFSRVTEDEHCCTTL